MAEHDVTTAPPQDSGTNGDTSALDSPPRDPRTLIAIGAAAIVLATVVAYVQVYRAEFIWDDDYYVTENPLLRSWAGLQRIWFDILPSPSTYPLPQYYPMTHTTFWLEYRLWGLNPGGYHVTNVLLHTLNALLIWFILRKLSVPGAWLAAAAFALHPIHVESVAWIAERKNVLSLFFFLGSLYVYLRYAGIIPPPAKPNEVLALPREPERVWGLALALFFFALASKTVTSTLPAVVLLIIWWKRGRIRIYQKDGSAERGFHSDVIPLLPFFVLGLAAASLTGYMEVHRVGATGPDWQHGSTALSDFAARLILAGQVTWFYVYKLIVPYPLIFNYPRWQLDIASPLQWLAPVSVLIVLAGLLATVRHVGRGPLTAVLFYLGTLFPAMGFFNVLPMRYAFVADHFVYLPSIGLIALAAGVLTWAAIRYLPREALSSGAPAAAAAAVLLIFLILTFAQTRIYANERALWEHTLRKTGERSWFAAANYAALLSQWGRDDEAEPWLHKVLRLKPDNHEAIYGLGLIAERRGDVARARELYEKSLSVRGDYVRPMYRLGVISQMQGRPQQAEEYFRRIMQLNPHDRLTPLTLGLLKEQQEQYDEALDLFQRASDIDLEWASPFLHAGNVLMKMGRPEEAMTRWAEASRLEPDNPAIAVGVGAAFASSEYYEEARVFFERALRLNPQAADVHRQLGIVLARLDQPELARHHLEEAVRLDPRSERAKQSLSAFNEGRITPATRPATAPATQAGAP